MVTPVYMYMCVFAQDIDCYMLYYACTLVLFWLIITTTKPPYSEPLKDLVNYTELKLWNHVLSATITKLDWPKLHGFD